MNYILLHSIGKLEITDTVNFALSKEVADIKDVSSKSGLFSRTLKINATKNNIKILSTIYDITSINNKFDKNNRQDCSLIVNDEVLYSNLNFKLIKVVQTENDLQNNSFENSYFECIIFDNSRDFFSKIKDKLLTDIKFDKLVTFDFDNIIDNWTNNNGTLTDDEKYYKFIKPLNTTSNNYNYDEFNPGIYVTKYLDKIFTNAGYSYTFENKNSNINRFKHLIIPYNGDKIDPLALNLDKEIIETKATLTQLYNTTTNGRWANNINTNITGSQQIVDNTTEVNDPNGRFDNVLGVYTSPFDYIGSNTITFNITYTYTLTIESADTCYIKATPNGSYPYPKGGWNLFVLPQYNNVMSQPIPLAFYNNQYQLTNLDTIPGETNPGELTGGVVRTIKTQTVTQTISDSNLNEFDQVYIDMNLRTQLYQVATSDVQWLKTSDNIPATVTLKANITDIKIEILEYSNSHYGITLPLDYFIPKNIKQSDFIKSLFTMFNLIVLPDPNDNNNLIIKNSDEYLDEGVIKNYENKVAYNQQIEYQWLSDTQKATKILTYKQDNDQYNKAYIDNVGETYGDLRYHFDNEYLTDSEKVEVIFSPTPIVKSYDNSFVPSIVGAAPKNNIRILYDAHYDATSLNDLLTCDTYTIWKDSLLLSSSFQQFTKYPYINHNSSIDGALFDLNFGLCDYYFYKPLALAENTLYELHHKRTFNRLNFGRLMTCYLNLTNKDFINLKFNDKLLINNRLWYINKIENFNPYTNELTKVELYSADDYSDEILKPRTIREIDQVKPYKNTKSVGKEFAYIRNEFVNNAPNLTGDKIFGENINAPLVTDGVLVGNNTTIKDSGYVIAINDDIIVNSDETNNGLTNTTVTDFINAQYTENILLPNTKYFIPSANIKFETDDNGIVVDTCLQYVRFVKDSTYSTYGVLTKGISYVVGDRFVYANQVYVVTNNFTQGPITFSTFDDVDRLIYLYVYPDDLGINYDRDDNVSFYYNRWYNFETDKNGLGYSKYKFHNNNEIYVNYIDGISTSTNYDPKCSDLYLCKNNIASFIFGNTVEIENNNCISIINNNTTIGIYYNKCYNISYNSNDGDIYNNSNSGSIYSNSNDGDISNNSNNGSISNNSNNGNIYGNSNNGSINSNSNIGNIYGNSNIGYISNNGTYVSFIQYNNNNGYISVLSGIGGPWDIKNNTNNGNITAAITANVTDPQVNK